MFQNLHIMKQMIRRLTGFLLFVLTVSPCFVETLSEPVVRNLDGDKVPILMDGNVQHKICIHGIDTPEKGQTFGKAVRGSVPIGQVGC